ncbi:DUF748 domain-containing protein [Agarivorans sp. B2Z047]|uniref:DUF748 domain-containing protein n=1 Tax=Agarivorans sp. B2Z047 TaxID=2652721 RepID=UPI00128D05C7|nr:DUF748 domain-containing protein [Agarivorans sp. B2Z047]MPW27985.1 DUF748 domain-containing protein [Agarivorans sp. B2Z047]UQN44184.1 DUF748 domain-containing protein [Agarivorans sp. B2Z047]
MKAATRIGQLKMRWQQASAWQKAGVYFVIVFMLYVVLSLSLLPWVIKQQVEKQLTVLTGHTVTLQQADFHPLKLSLTLRHFAIKELDEQQSQPLASFERLYVDFTLSSLFYWSWNFEALELDGLFFHLSRQKNGALNVDSLFPNTGEPQEAEPENSEQASVPRLRVKQFMLRNAQLKLSDYLPEQAVDFSISDFDLLLNDFYTQRTGDAANAYRIEAQVGEQGRLAWSGEVDLPASQVSGQFSLEEFQLPRVFAFLRPYTDLRINQGAVTLSTDYLIDYQQQFQFITEQGLLSIEQFELSAFEETRAKFEQLSLNNITFDLNQQHLSLGDIGLNQGLLAANFDQDSQLDWLSWFHFEKLVAETQTPEAQTLEAGEQSDATPTVEQEELATESSWVLSNNSIKVNDFELRLGEAWLGSTKQHQLLLQALSLSGFSSDMQQTTELTLDASLYQQSPLNAKLAFSGPEQRLTGQVSLSQLALTQLEKWYSPFVRLDINSGQLALSSELDMQLADSFALTSSNGRLALSQVNLAVSQHTENLHWLAANDVVADGVDVNLTKQTVDIASLSSEALEFIASLDEQGNLDIIEYLGFVASENSSTDIESEPQSDQTLESEATNLDEANDVSLDTQTKPKLAQNAAAAEEETDATTREEQVGWLVNIAQLSAANSRISLSEMNSGQELKHQLNAPLIELSNISSDMSASMTIAATLQAEQGGELAIDGEIALAIKQADLTLKATQFGLAFYQAYLAQYTELKLESAKFNTDMQVQLDWQEQFGLALKGPLSIDELHLKDARAQSDLLKWSEFNLSQLDLDTRQRRLALGELNFIQPYFLIEVSEDFSTNLAGIVKSPEEGESSVEQRSEELEEQTSEPVAANDSASWQISIAQTQFSQGLVDFADYSLDPNFAAKIEKVEGKIGSLTQDASQPAEVSLSGEVDGYAPVSFAGEIAPLAADPAFDAALDFKHLELTRLNAYSGTYAGYVIERGQMSLALAYKLKQSQLQGSNQVYIEQLQLGKRTNSEKATSLPVELAIALLEDDQGVIDLGLEVSGDVNDPDFNVGGLVFKALGGALKKIVTSPFALIGSLIGSDETLNEVSFVAGSSEIEQQQLTQLGQLAEGLKKRPQLKIALVGSIDPAQDIPALKRQALAEQLNQQANLDIAPQDISLSAVLENRSLRTALVNLAQVNIEEASRNEDRQQLTQSLQEQEQLSPERLNQELHSLWYQRLVDQQTLNDGDLESFAEQRAIAVKDVLTEQNELAIARAFVQRQALDKQSGKMLVTLSIIAD